MAVRAPNEPSAEFHNHGEDPTRAFSWLKVHISTFTFKTLTRPSMQIYVAAALPLCFKIINLTLVPRTVSNCCLHLFQGLYSVVMTVILNTTFVLWLTAQSVHCTHQNI